MAKLFRNYNQWLYLTVLSALMAVAGACLTVPPAVVVMSPPVIVQPTGPQALHVDGNKFVQEDGTEYRWKGVTDFELYLRYLNGEDITPILRDRVGVGANLVRVLGMVDSFAHLYPQEHPDYFDKLGPFVDLLASYGLRVEFVVFADAQIIMPDQPTQLAHWQRVAATLGGKKNVFLQVVNQGDKNGVDSLAFPSTHAAFPWVLESRDSGMESANPKLPPLDYSAYTSTRSDVKWFVETGSSMYYVLYGWGTPEWQGTIVAGNAVAIDDEPMGADETDQPGKRSNNPGYFKQLARSLVWGNGATFHSTAGITSDIFGPIQHNAAVEFLGNLP